MRSLVLATLLAAAALGAAGCMVNPVSGKSELSLISPSREKEIGKEAAKQIEVEMGFVDDKRLADYVSQVGKRVAVESPLQGVDYTFHVVDMSEPNAFALPGGYVYVTRGILAVTTSEDELAGVLGHEIGHVAARHAVQRVSRAAPLGILTGLGAATAGLVSPTLGAAVGGFGAAANEMLLAPYGREQEREADRVGAEMSAKAGFDPTALADALRGLEREEAIGRKGKSSGASFFATHPPLPERVESVRAYAETLPRGPHRPIVATDAAYLEKLDGLVIGKSAAQGVFDGQRFIHPELHFTMDFPAGWKTQNSRDAVGASAPDGRAAIVLDVAALGNDPMDALRATDKASGTDLAARAVPTTINGAKAAEVSSPLKTEVGVLTITVTVIAHGGRLYRIIGAARPADAAANAQAFRTTSRSFRTPTAPELARIRESRLRIVRARAGETIPALVTRTGSIWEPAMVAAANGLPDGARLANGQLVKVALNEPSAAAH